MIIAIHANLPKLDSSTVELLMKCALYFQSLKAQSQHISLIPMPLLPWIFGIREQKLVKLKIKENSSVITNFIWGYKTHRIHK